MALGLVELFKQLVSCLEMGNLSSLQTRVQKHHTPVQFSSGDTGYAFSTLYPWI